MNNLKLYIKGGVKIIYPYIIFDIMKSKILNFIILAAIIIGMLPTSALCAESPYPSGKVIELKTDTWSFENYADDIPDNIWVDIFGEDILRYGDTRNKLSGGRCFGMSAYAAAISAGYEKIPGNYDSVANVKKSNKEALNKIARYQLLQYTELYDNQSAVKYSDVVAGIQAGKTYLVELAASKKGEEIIHTFLVDTSSGASKSWIFDNYTICLYDPNLPKDDNPYIEINPKKGTWKIEFGFNVFSGNETDRFNINARTGKQLEFKDIEWLQSCGSGQYELSFKARNLLLMNANGYKCSQWAESTIAQADKKNLIPPRMIADDLTAPIKREEFAAIAVNLYENLSGKKADGSSKNVKFSDVSGSNYIDYIYKAANLGFIYGNPDGTFAPDAELTREDMAVILSRVYSFLYGKIPDFSTDEIDKIKFKDHKLISDYAIQSVYFMSSRGIIKGMGDDKFAPKGGEDGVAIREQAIVLANRCLTEF